MDKTQLNKAYFDTGDWLHTTYKGIQLLKFPSDLLTYMAVLYETNPDLIIETGTHKGGSALFLKDCSKADVITIDTEPVAKKYDGITYLTQDSLTVKLNTKKYKRIMVVLDSDHHKDHVLAELQRFAPLVSKGCYLVTEDTFISDYLGNPEYPDGSVREALNEWDSSGFELQDDRCTITMNPGGWWKRA